MTATGRTEDRKSALRLLCLLQLVPRAPLKKSTSQLMQQLHNLHGFQVTQRTIQRDLMALRDPFRLISDEAKPAGWSFTRAAAELALPKLDPVAALAYHLAGEHLRGVFPQVLLQELEPRLEAACQIVSECQIAGVGQPILKWAQRIVSLPAGLQLLPPSMPPGVVQAVHSALLARLQLQFDYQGYDDAQPKPLSCHPIALVVRGPLCYLIARIRDYPDVRHLPLHRMCNVSETGFAATDPESFELSAYLAQNKLDWRFGADVHLRFEAKPSLAQFLGESRLSVDQMIAPAVGGWHLVTATLADTYELERWLNSQGKLLRRVSRVTLPHSLGQRTKTDF